MTAVDRRSFVQLGLAAAAAMTIDPLPARAHGHHGEDADGPHRGVSVPPTIQSFSCSPTLVADSSGTQSSVWAYAADAAGVADDLVVARTLNASTVMEWLTGDELPADGDPDTLAFLRALAVSTPVGGSTAPDVAALMLSSALAGEDYLVDLTFMLDQRTAEIGDAGGIAVLRLPTPSKGGAASPFETPYLHLDIGNYRFQFRPNHAPAQRHGLGNCAPWGSPHIHLEVFYSKNPKVFGWGKAAAVLHLGTYKEGSKRCFFAGTSGEMVQKSWCRSRCLPTFEELRRLYESAIVYAAAAAGTTIVGWLVTSMAYTLAGATYGVMIAL